MQIYRGLMCEENSDNDLDNKTLRFSTYVTSQCFLLSEEVLRAYCAPRKSPSWCYCNRLSAPWWGSAMVTNLAVSRWCT